MNNNMNNNFNNNFNNQSLNMQNQQSVQSQPMNPQPVNPATQQFMQNQQSVQPQPMNNVNPNMNQMYYYNNTPNNTNGNKSKSNKTLFIIIGISIAVVLTIIILVFALGSKNKTVNEYEENGNSNITNNENTTETHVDEKTYKGFKFTKISGYIYGEESGVMTVQDNKNMVMLDVTKVPFSLVKANYTSLISALTSKGWTVGQSKIDTYSGTEVITFEVTLEEISGLYFIIASPNSEYVYEGFTTNIAYTVNYSDVNLVVDVSKSSTYIGDYSGYSTDFGVDFQIKEIQ